MHTPPFCTHLEQSGTLQNFFLHFFFDEPFSLLSVELAASFLFRVADGVLLVWTTFGMMCNFCSDGVNSAAVAFNSDRPPTHCSLSLINQQCSLSLERGASAELSTPPLHGSGVELLLFFFVRVEGFWRAEESSSDSSFWTARTLFRPFASFICCKCHVYTD
jgi:hypothetical protein